MSATAQLRVAVTGLTAFAAAAEETLLTSTAPDTADPGDELRWAAVPTIAHNTEFKAQQAERITAVLAGRVPPAFGEIDHKSAAVYARYAARAASAVAGESRRVTASLLDGVRALADDDLVDPSRHPWLNGRPLWLQVIVRGFWHPTGHVADYYLRHGQPSRAVALQEHMLATTRHLGAPSQVAGMAAYSLACAQAASGAEVDAARTLAEAIALNPDVRANADRDPDLEPLRLSGQLTAILAG
ncbi:MAG TPA: hypothetical protein VIL16_33450 [Trebonia sp.]